LGLIEGFDMGDVGKSGRLNAIKSDDRREIWSFFSGAMGLDLGLEAAKLAPTLAVEIDPIFCRTIRANRPELDLIEGDVSTLTATALRERRGFDGEVFLMAGGPPCQPFSSGGKRAALSDPRGNLIYEYFRLIAEVRPRYFVLENVANLTTAALRHRPIAERPGKHWSLKRYAEGSLNRDDGKVQALEEDELSGSALRQIIGDATTLGYHISFGVVDAADFGAPQHRLRFVMLGSRDHPPAALPKATHGTLARPYVTVRDAIYGLRENPGAHSTYTDGVHRFFAMVPEGGNWRSLPLDVQRLAMGKSFDSGGGKTGFFRRLSWERPAPTITGRANRKGSALCHPEQVRPISVPEAAALQGFPADWQFIGAMNAQYMQVGNAVPVPLGKAIGAAILKHDASKRQNSVRHPDMDTMMARAVERLRASARNKVAKAA
jgi:DNA (cytosine-5)-methyltransferase 1